MIQNFIGINTGMYGMKKYAIISYIKLVKHVNRHRYYPILFTPGLWAHINLATKLYLCVDDLGVQYFSKDEADHLLDELKKHYAVSTDWEGGGGDLTIDWGYKNVHVNLSRPYYIPKTLKLLQRPKPNKSQYMSCRWTKPVYGQHIQIYPETDSSTPLSKRYTKFILSIVGTLL